MSDLTREKRAAGDYEFRNENDARFRVQKEDGAWIAARLTGDGEEPIDTFDTLTAAEDALAELDVVEESVETVAWSIENNPNSKAHRTADGKVTACGLNIPSGKELDAEPRGECGVCYR